MAYIGSSAAPIPVAFAAVQSQSFNGTGSQTAFTITRSVPSAASLEVLVNNVQQSPYDGSYSVSGTTLTFSEAPSSGTNNVYVIYRDQALGSLVDPTAYRKGETDTLLAAKQNSLGYTPVNKAGDTMTGALALTSGSSVGAGTYALLKFGGDAAADDFHFVRETSGFNLYSGVSGAGTKRFGVDASGRVTTPYQPSWSADFNSFTCTNASQVYYPVYNTPEINVGGHFNTSTGRMTAPVSGVYLLMGSFLRNSNSYVFRGRFYKNGVSQTEGEYRTTEGFSGYNESSTFTQIVYATAGDTLGWGISCDVSGGSIYASGYNYFAGYLLG